MGGLTAARAQEVPEAPVKVSEMSGGVLTPGFVHLTYFADSGRRAWRSSVWRLTEVGWREVTTGVWTQGFMLRVIADPFASLKSRSISTGPSLVFAVAVARPDKTARAAASASTASVLP